MVWGKVILYAADHILKFFFPHLEVIGTANHLYETVQLFLHPCGNFCGCIRLTIKLDTDFEIL